jgi:two-component system, chemotaxis family, protein-glutamate methylesterase/glutaminase
MVQASDTGTGMNPHNRAPIRVLLVDDSPLALTALRRLLSASPEIQVVGTAQNGREALELIPQLQPAVICTDLHMPVMDGLELTREVMLRYPRPILVVSVSVQRDDTTNIFRLLEAGAVDVCPKPRSGLVTDEGQVTQELIAKIKILSGVVVFRRHRRTSLPPAAPGQAQRSVSGPAAVRIVAIGASTGGPQALQTILTELPADFPAPILCVQHISDGFLQGLVDWLAAQCRLKVKIAQPGELALPGTIYFPQERTHLEIDDNGRLMCSLAPPLEGHCPSVTLTFQSIARSYGSAAVGILLTGMGRDGAEGMRAIAQVAGITIAQDEESCVVFGMPKHAIDLGTARYILPVKDIARTLTRLLTSQPR